MNGVAGSFDPPDLTVPLPGRQLEQQELSSLLDRALRGYGSMVLISGEAGIGKTTLGDRLATQARQQQALVLVGNCYGTTTGQPFAPWLPIRDALLSALPDAPVAKLSLSPESVETPDSQEELHERIAHDIRQASNRQPLVIIIEDIHWADTASLELLRYLARQVMLLPVMLVATYREDEPETAGTLPELLPDLIRESRAQRFELRRLTLPDVESIVQASQTPGHEAASLQSLSTYLHSRSEGNPFFLTELLRELVRIRNAADVHSLPVPSLVRQVIENRVRKMTSESQTLLGIASVIGQEVPVDLWQRVSSVNDVTLASVIEEAVANHILRETGEGTRVRFIHGLIQETLYQGQIALRRRGWHRQIAECLISGPDPSPDAIAHHFACAGDERTVDWLVQAAGRALNIYAARDAIRSIDRVGVLAEQFAIPVPLQAYRMRALAREMLGETELARTDFAMLLQSARDSGDRALECQALMDLGLLWAGQDYQRCGEYLSQALTIAEGLGDDRVHAQCLNRFANWRANTGALEPAIELHQAALHMFEANGDLVGIADTLDLLGTSSFLAGEYADALAWLERSVAISRDQGNKRRLSSSLALLGNLGGDMDSTFDAETVASRSPEYWIGAGEESVQIARDIGWISGEAFALSMLSAIHCVRGKLGQALKCAETAQEIAQRIGHQQWLIASSLVLGIAWAELLDQSRAEYYLERTLSHARSVGSHLWIVVTLAALANVRLERSETNGMALLRPFVETELSGHCHAQRTFQLAWANQLRVAGDLDDALEMIETLLSYNTGSGVITGTPQILKVRAEILRDMGRLDEAEVTLADAATSAELLGFKAMHWRVQLARGELESRRGREHEARAHLQEARVTASEIARDISEPETRRRFLERIDQRISSVSHSGLERTDTAGLSPREIEVLRLVASGLTDAQVAEQLFISPRTVARHLQSIYTKLDVNSRTAATRFAWEHSLLSRG